MRELANTVLTAALAFVSTNIDDIFVLMLFYAQVTATFRPKHIVTGQYLGFSALVAVSTLGYFGTLVIPREWIGLLGIAPIALGVRRLIQRDEEIEDDPASEPKTPLPGRRSLLGALLSPQSYSVAAVTVANGGDNIGIYVPLFARGTVLDLGATVAVFLLLVAVWCYLGAVLAYHPTIAKALKLYGRQVVPIVLIGLGILILWGHGTLGLLGRRP